MTPVGKSHKSGSGAINRLLVDLTAYTAKLLYCLSTTKIVELTHPEVYDPPIKIRGTEQKKWYRMRQILPPPSCFFIICGQMVKLKPIRCLWSGDIDVVLVQLGVCRVRTGSRVAATCKKVFKGIIYPFSFLADTKWHVHVVYKQIKR